FPDLRRVNECSFLFLPFSSLLSPQLPSSLYCHSSRPGRPPKRTQSVTSPENPHIMPHSVPGLMSPGMIPPTAANAAIAEAMKVKKIKLEAMSGYHGNANHHGADGENGDLSSGVASSSCVSGLELPFMMMPHPLIPVSLPPASVTMAMSQMNHLSTIANMAAAAQGQSLPSRMVTSVIKERVPDSPSPAPSLEDNRRPGSHPSSHRSSSVSSSPAHTENSYERLSLAGQTLPPGFPSPFLFPDGLSSIETLLTNIQGLLKVAIDNARAQEKQVQLEKTELKMELFRERELRETLEKQLAMEQKNRAIIQKRLKKEKKAKRKLQEALEYESKRREQVEQTLKQPSPSDSMRSLNGQKAPNITFSPFYVSTALIGGCQACLTAVIPLLSQTL
uniref:Dachshund d n=1 Tax=Xiphophorus couchianus TaxID=32473 RepID=A0A3B5MMY9_9TELE